MSEKDLPRYIDPRYRGLFEQMNACVAIYRAVDDGRDFSIVDFNPAAERLERVSRQDVVGRSVSEAFPGIEEFGLVEVLRRVWQTGKSEQHPITMYRDQRITGWRENHVFKLPTGEVAAVYTDAMKTRQSEEALRQSEDRYRRLVENLRQEYFFYSHDPDGVFTYLSPSITDILGYSADEFLTDYDKHFTDDPVNQQARQYTARSIGGEQQPPYEVDLYHRHGGTRRLVVIEVPVLDDQGRVMAVEGIARDVTARRAMEQEMLKTQKLESLGVMAGGIAHDFNNLLTVISGNLSLTGQTAVLSQEVQEQLADARQAADQAKLLTQQLLTFSRGGLPVKKSVVLHELLIEAVKLATSGSNVATRLDVDRLHRIDADPGQLQQVISNVCINAVQAMSEGGTLEVNGSIVEIGNESPLPLDPGNYVRIQLKDDGPGIPPENLDRLFDPYFTTKDAGTGLGLTVCYSVVRNHGGHIVVDSVPGWGTTVEIYLPSVSTEQPPAVEQTSRPPAEQVRVLVMDDDDAVIRLVTRMIATLGCSVDTASDGARAIDLYAKAREDGHPFDLVILDLTVPGGLGGKETLQRLREIDPGVRAVVSSGYSNDPVMAEHRAHGFIGVLTKPYGMDQMQELLVRIERERHDNG